MQASMKTPALEWYVEALFGRENCIRFEAGVREMRGNIVRSDRACHSLEEERRSEVISSMFKTNIGEGFGSDGSLNR